MPELAIVRGVKSRKIKPIVIFALAGTFLPFLAGPMPATAADSPDAGWNLESKSGNLVLYSRIRPSSPIKEFKAVTDFEASTRVVHNVLNDVEAYPKFMPFTSEARVLRRENSSSVLTYQRLSPKICGDRDYTLRIHQTSRPATDGLVFLDRWELANELGPPEKPNVLRVRICEGSWLLEPAGNDKTRAKARVLLQQPPQLSAELLRHHFE